LEKVEITNGSHLVPRLKGMDRLWTGAKRGSHSPMPCWRGSAAEKSDAKMW
jgi:hypothetical protein